MKVSVIIPVYNAGKYVEEAVASALFQKEVREILLIEDGSPDNSLEVCKKLEEKYEKVKLFQHPNGENRGAGETRNVGLRMATQEYIAFLDADDFYLENRFEVAKKVFENPDVDGVYEAIGVHFENEEEKKKWNLRSGKSMTTVSEKVSPRKLFPFLVLARKGHFHLNGLTIKKKIINEDFGFFNNNLKISQDTHFCLKLALTKNLFAGSIKKIVARRRFHKDNRITKVDVKKMFGYQSILWTSLLNWSKDKKIKFSERSIIYFMQYRYAKLVEISEINCSNFRKNIYLIFAYIFFLIKNPLKGGSVFINIIYFH